MDGEMLEQELAADPDGPLHIDCIESPIYADVRSMLNVKMAELLAEIYGGDFTGGDVTLKLSFDMRAAVEDVTVQDEGGEAATVGQPYKNPTFDFAVNATLKKTSKDKGSYSDKRKLVMEDGRFLAAPIPSPQITMAELAAHRRDEPLK